MKHTLLFTILVLLFFTTCSQVKKSEKASESTTSTTATTYYFIRHAEKDRSNASESDPHLIEDGLVRAENWSNILAHVKFDAVYATEFQRTQETAKPTADKNSLGITIYDQSILNDVSDFMATTKGKHVLVVGHSNTTPTFVNAVIKQTKYEDIDDSNNGNLYIVTIVGDVIVDHLLTIN